MKYTAIKEEQTNKITELHNECGLFWAFSNEQFAEGKATNPLQEGDKYASIGMGGYLPKSNVDQLLKGMKEIDKWYKAEIKKAKAKEVILYELNNHECFYTGEIDDAVDVLTPMGYTVEQIKKVYHENREFDLN